MFDAHFHEFDRHSNPFEKRSRMFKKGDMKYVILELLKNKPAHGYELTMALEEKFQGLYSPSAGSVYPVLQLLEDMGYVTSIHSEGKKVYTISDSGKQFLEDQKEITDKIGERLRGWWGSQDKQQLQTIRETMGHIHEIRHLIGSMAVQRDATRIARLNEILAKTVADLKGI
jgi:DNA-binding PadR family transcriptional regulator